MSHLKESIRSLAQPLAPLRLSERAHVREAAERIPAGHGADRPRAHKNYDDLARLFLERLAASQPLSGRELRDAAWCLWTTTPALAEHRPALLKLLADVEESERRTPGRALASSYVTSFEPMRPGVREVSETLQWIAERLGRPWADLQRELQVFHWRDGTNSVARRAIDERTSPSAILQRSGLGALNAQSGFARACSAALMEQLAGEQTIDAADRLSLVKDLALDERGRLLFDDHAPLVANALTLPFGDALPDKAIRDRYLDLLLDLFKDPRLPQSRWTRMPEAAAQVRRWLTEQSLRQFLDVVDEIAIERMWKYRRAFWDAVYRAGLISNAWVVFEPTGAAQAQRSFGKDISFARFDGMGVQAGQAVLLLRIGRSVVAEWSQNGRCYIWDDADRPGAPKLYRSRYAPQDLRLPRGADENGVFSCVHGQAETYGWQQRVADKIKEITNMRILQTDYRVR